MAHQSVWHVAELGRLGESILLLTLEANEDQSLDFKRGATVAVMALAHAVGATVRLPEPFIRPAVEIVEATQ